MDARPLSRRSFLRLSALLAGGVTLLSACSSQPAARRPKPAEPAKPAEAAKPAAPAAAAAPTQAAPAAKPAEAAKPAAAAATGKPVSPIAAAGGLKETTITVIIFSGPEADAHTRLAPKFTEYTKGKVKVQVEEGGRGDAYDAKWLAGHAGEDDGLGRAARQRQPLPGQRSGRLLRRRSPSS